MWDYSINSVTEYMQQQPGDVTSNAVVNSLDTATLYVTASEFHWTSIQASPSLTRQ